MHVGWLLEKVDHKLIPTWAGLDDDTAVIMDIKTEAATRGHGIATESVRQMMNDAANQNSTSITAIVPADATSLRRLLERLGFIPTRQLIRRTLLGRTGDHVKELEPWAAPVPARAMQRKSTPHRGKTEDALA